MVASERASGWAYFAPIPEEMWERLETLAERNGRSVEEEILHALRCHVEREEAHREGV